MKAVTTFLLLSIVVSASAQRYVDTYNPKDEEVKSLLGKGNDLNLFGGADVKITDLVGEKGLLAGGYGGVLVNRRYFLALAGYGITTNIEFDGTVGTEEKPLNLYGGYGGMMVGMMVGSKEVIHLTFPIFFGAGQMEISDKNFFPNSPNDAEFAIENSAFIVIEPGAQLEFNITENFRLGAGVSYRYITGSELDNVSDEDLSGSSISLSFRFGRF